MARLSDAMREYLVSKSIDWMEEPRCNDRSVRTCSFGARGNTCSMSVRVAVDDEAQRIGIHVFGGANAMFARMAEANRLLMWASNGDPFGRFLLHGLNGDICYAVAANCECARADIEGIGRIIEVAAARYDRIFRSLVRAIYAHETADSLIPITETPTWEPLMQSIEAAMPGITFAQPDSAIPGAVLSVCSVQLAYGGVSANPSETRT